jgi:hypothetical protein
VELTMHGRLGLIVVRPDGTVRERQDADNVICTTGLTALAAALVWSGIEDQAAALGVTTPTYLTPLYGAVGDGAGTPAASDSALFNELSRQPVGSGGYAPASSGIPSSVTWQFYFPSPSSTWTLTEAGLFTAATADSGSGSMLDHLAFTPSLTVPTTDTLILQATFTLSG